MTPDNVDPLVITYLKAEFAKLNSKNKLEVENLHGGKPWVYVVLPFLLACFVSRHELN